MSLEGKSLTELAELRDKLFKKIQGNPLHSRIEQVELDDVNQWIATKTRSQKRETVAGESKFEVADK
jgi:hypothetical protein